MVNGRIMKTDKEEENMADYTKINFMDIEANEGDLQMRFARKDLGTKDVGVTYTKYAPGYRNEKAHSHEAQEEVYVVVGGSGRILLDDKVEELKKWDVIRVAPETVRTFEAGPDGLELIAVGGPKPPEGDGVKAEANWPD